MTLFLAGADVTALGTDGVVIGAARQAVACEDAAGTVVPTRIQVPTATGFLRVMPAAMDGVMGLKVMTLVEGLGTRYLLLVHDTRDGELVGVLDAEEITRLRTAATTALAGELLCSAAPEALALIGTGFEAEGHLRLLARFWPLADVTVFSPSRERREHFAAERVADLGCAIRAVDSAAAALASAATVVLATKSETPVVDGADFLPASVVLSIGSTRPDLRELDRATFARAAAVLVDDPAQVASESGDVLDAVAAGALEPERIVSLAAAGAEPSALRAAADRDLLVFKSVGTAIQDLALARAVLDAARRSGRGRDLGELARLKPFADALRVAATATLEDAP